MEKKLYHLKIDLKELESERNKNIIDYSLTIKKLKNEIIFSKKNLKLLRDQAKKKFSKRLIKLPNKKNC